MDIEYLLEFENNNEDILNFRLFSDEILIWPYLRFPILHKAITTDLHLQPHFSGRKNINTDLEYYKEAFSNNPFREKRGYDIVMLGTARGNTIKKNNRFFNYFYDYFALCFPQESLIIEDSFQEQFYLPRYFNNFRTHDGIMLSVFEKARHLELNSNDALQIKEFINFFKKRFPIKLDENFYNQCICMLRAYAKRLELYSEYYRILFYLLKPKIIFLHCASYGERSYIVKWAKDMGIKVGEFQHGAVNRNHIAYNYSKMIHDHEEYQKYLPDYFLTYGEYWNKSTRTPSKKINIGNPFYTERQIEFSKKRTQKNEQKKIMIISQGTITEVLVNITKELATKVKNQDITIIYRLHPGEVPFIERYKDLYNYVNVQVSNSGDIYDLIYMSDYIIGVYSTAVLESIGFNKPIFILEHELSTKIPKDIGFRFKNAEELYNLLNYKSKSVIDGAYYWNNGWDVNYKNFINSIL